MCDGTNTGAVSKCLGVD